MAEIVKAWGSEYDEFERNAEYKAQESAKRAVWERMNRAGLAAVDDIEVVRTVELPAGAYKCQAAVRAVRK